MDPFLIFFVVLELKRGYLYQKGVGFRQKVIGAGLNFTTPRGVYGPFPRCRSRERVPQ